jgi:hypothetical protein
MKKLRLQELQVIFHLLGGQHRPNEDQRPKHLSDDPRLLTAIDNPRMGNAPLVKPKVVVIMGRDDVALSTSEGKMLLVRRALQARLNCGGDVDTTPSQHAGDRRMDMRIMVGIDRRPNRR